MDFKRLRYLIAIADTGSFSAAAKRAFVTQPTLSVAIAGLEAELGAKLLERRSRGIALTDEGRRVLVRARAILREVEAMSGTGGEGRSERSLRLGLLPSLPPRLVVATLQRIESAQRTSRHFRAEYATADQLRRRLVTGRYDAILTSLQRPLRGERQLELAQDRQMLAYGRAWKPTCRVTPRILHEQPLIVRTHCEFLQAASRLLDSWQVRPRVIARTESDLHALALVSAGLGACLMPDSIDHEGVVFVHPEGVDLRRRLGLAWIKGARNGFFEALERSER